eukprot:TRINITY_DN11967_c0_g2_i3.p1 TRINITY_DN11967_c0_g2~~TRINITY_DN11967_c0_g2_i3.p1  ORF type:complete len:876 (+),score=296.90 TRINITY_DN11967_c0_g2_i3:68-2695(+)
MRDHYIPCLALATHAVRKAANALAEEGELLNVYAELKDVAQYTERRARAQERVSKTIARWTERKKETPRIRQFLSDITAVENDMVIVERAYNEEFKVFMAIWKNVLAEKKELNSKVDACRKAQRNLEQAQKKVQQAEAKQEHDKLVKAKKQLESIQQGHLEVRKAMEVKLLEVQQEKHNVLKSGYMALYKAQMQRSHDLVKLESRLRKIVNDFPAVKVRNDDGTFEYEESSEPPEEEPIWCQGVEFLERLRVLESEHQAHMDELHRKHDSALSGLLRERDEMDAQKNESYSAEVVGMMQKNKMLTDELRAQHERALKSAEEQRARMQQDYDKQIKALQSQVAQLSSQVKARHRQVLNHVAETHRLEETMEQVKLDVVTRARTHAHSAIDQAIAALSEPCAEYFFAQTHTVVDAFQDLITEAQRDNQHVEFDNAAAAFTTHITHVLSAGWALARCSKAEMTSELLEELVRFAQVGKQGVQQVESAPALSNKRLLQRSRTREELDLKASGATAAPAVGNNSSWMLAAYDHEAKDHQGTKLLGFKKGDKLELIKSRDDGWCKVRLGSQQGWAPLSFLKPMAQPAVEDKEKADADQEEAEVTEMTPEAAKALTTKFQQAVQTLETTAKKIVARDRELAALANALAGGIESKVSAAEQSVLDALSHIEKMRAESRSNDAGRRLEVNTNLLDLAEKICTTLRELMVTAKNVRQQLESTRGMSTVDEFNDKHRSWFEALTTAVDTMFEGLPVLTEALRSVVRKEGKHEELQVSARNLSATVAQLAAMTRTKAMPDNDTSQADLNRAAEAFKTTVHSLLAACRECHELDLASVLLEDYDGLSETEAKRLVMSTQVNVLKMESQLEKEHEKLRRLRRMVNYEDN